MPVLRVARSAELRGVESHSLFRTRRMMLQVPILVRGWLVESGEVLNAAWSVLRKQGLREFSPQTLDLR